MTWRGQGGSLSRMDMIDRKILAELQRDARQSNTELADHVHLTQSPCLRRVRRLEEIGVIIGYHAHLNRDLLGFGLMAFVAVTMRDEQQSTIMAFEKRLSELPEIVEAYRLFGEPDYLLRVATTNIRSYERLYSSTLASLPGVATVTSLVPMKIVKERHGVPIEILSSHCQLNSSLTLRLRGLEECATDSVDRSAQPGSISVTTASVTWCRGGSAPDAPASVIVTVASFTSVVV